MSLDQTTSHYRIFDPLSDGDGRMVLVPEKILISFLRSQLKIPRRMSAKLISKNVNINMLHISVDCNQCHNHYVILLITHIDISAD